MTKSQMFKKAHEIARATKAIVGDYRIAFSIALKDIYSGRIEMEEKSELTKKVEALVSEINEALEAHKANYTMYNAKRLLTVANGAYIKMVRMECRAEKDEAALKAFDGIDWDCYNNEMALANKKVRYASHW